MVHEPHRVPSPSNVLARTLWVELHKLFQALKCGKLSVVSPHSMVSALWHLLPCFRGYTQQVRLSITHPFFGVGGGEI